MKNQNPFAAAKILRAKAFTDGILLKNSFGSAMGLFLAGIPSRTGYVRDGRGFLLTNKLYPAKDSRGKFMANPMVDYYLAIAESLGCDVSQRQLELTVDEDKKEELLRKLPSLAESGRPVVILVPGGAFGPSKCWMSERFAQTADWLIDRYNAQVVISVSPNPFEKRIADEICSCSGNQFINLAQTPVTLGELKSLFSMAQLVITNDTGPRHIAIALGRRVVTLFGPNDPAWTDTGYEKEIKLTPEGPCVMCGKPVCDKPAHFCMESITVEKVCQAAQRLLGENGNR